MVVDWATDPKATASGNTLGYGTANREMKAALGRRGFSFDAQADVQLHLCFPKVYRPRDSSRSLLFTMFESTEYEALRDVYAPAFKRADMIVTCSAWCRDLFADWTDKPIELCPLGIDPKLFEYKRRRWRPHRLETFRLLYVGAPNKRKWTVLPEVYQAAIAPFPGLMQLYVKTTGAKVSPQLFDGGSERFTWEKHPEGDVFRGSIGGHEIITLDCRLLPRERVPELYHRAHAAILPHCGEGWGQTAQEAMATGLPLIVSNHSGTREFTSHQTAYLVDTPEQTLDRGFAGPVRSPWPTAGQAVAHVGTIVSDYRRATVVAKRGSDVARALTWDAAAARLASLVHSMV